MEKREKTYDTSVEKSHKIDTEKYTYAFLGDVITISGPSGVGKTVLSERLSGLLHMDNRKTGQRFRKQLPQQDVVGYAQRGFIVDKKLDESTENTIRNSRKRKRKVIIEGRLAGFIARNAINNMYERNDRIRKSRHGNRTKIAAISTIATIRIDAADDVRFERIRKRENEKIAERNDATQQKNEKIAIINALNQRIGDPLLSYQPLSSFYTHADIETRTLNRESGDLKTWGLHHQVIQDGLNPLSGATTIEDEFGMPMYDINIDASKKSVDQVFEEVVNRLIQLDLIKIEEKKRIPKSCIIYSANVDEKGTIVTTP